MGSTGLSVIVKTGKESEYPHVVEGLRCFHLRCLSTFRKNNKVAISSEEVIEENQITVRGDWSPVKTFSVAWDSG